jgi:O-antigen/teichoic acid export membrane protein
MLIRHSLFNLIGLGVPLFAAVFSIPILIDTLGADRFGILTLIWAIVSYFGLFDLGLGRALTLQLSRYLATNKEVEGSELVWTALLIMTGLGVLAGILLYFCTPLGLEKVESTMDAQEQATGVLYMALALPFILLTTGYRGVLESKGAFLVINAIRVPMGIFTFIGPLMVVWFWQVDLGAITFILFLGRVIGCVAHALAAHAVFPRMNVRPVINILYSKILFSTGGWMSLSNIVGPLMGYIDRFVIGAVVSAAAVAYYATPHEMVMKLGIIPGALTAVIFPNIAAMFQHDKKGVKKLLMKGVLAVSSIMVPVTIFLTVFSHDILSIWISPEFSEESYLVLIILSVGMMVGCLAQLPFSLIQGAGHSRFAALLHLIEFPVYVLTLWAAVEYWSITGAAIVWFFKSIIDAIIMFCYSHKLLKPAS